ncbi:MAG TPA: glycosyltransferase family 9 protein [Thermodesulfobacteriota bacterium]|nr:glycosyltransferase family 9 protein [Thermodesulfobacteriota bacterium]
MMVSSHPTKASGVQSILVIHQGAVGDFVLALPGLEVVRKAFPQAKSVLMGYPGILELAEKRFYADEILSVDQRGVASFFVPEGPLDPSLSQFFRRFDLVAVFGRDGEGPVVKNLRRVCQGRVLHIHSFPSWNEKVHLTDHILKQFAHYGFTASGSIPKLYLKEEDREWARGFWKSKGVTPEERQKIIILHPGSGSKKKVWPLDRFINLAHVFQHHLGSRILIILGPAEGPEVEKAFEGMRPFAPVLAKGLTLLQLASVMEGCRFFVGNDSGISHLAAAIGLPTVAVFGPTDEEVWSPRGEKTFVVSRRVHCSPCTQERLVRCKDFECLRGIEIEHVLEGVKRIGIELKF